MSLLDRFHGGYVHSRRVDVLCRRLSPLLPPGARVLDVGCGDGLLARRIAQARPDITIEGIDVLVREDARIPVEPFDGQRIPHADKSFDAVLFVDVLHHTEDPRLLLREAARVARRAILIKDHTRNGLLAGPTLRFMDRVGNARHGVVLPYNYWSHREWLDAFRTLGLHVDLWEKKLGLYPFPASWIFGRSLHFIARLEPAGGRTPLDPWEAAYARFETPRQEVRKFIKRLRQMGADRWPRDAEIAELFCGRGNGLHALSALGFTRIEGVDLSPALLAQYTGPARCTVGDCRSLPFADGSKDIVIIQGGLHHLPTLPDDLDQTLSEVARVLREDGRFMVVEPWLTPFLRFVHAVCGNPAARRLSPKLDALATMIHHERRTYEQWLRQPRMISGLFHKRFHAERDETSWGKLLFLGRPR